MPRPSSMMYRVWLEGTQEGYRGIVECTLKGLDIHQVSVTGEEGIVGKGACEVIQWCDNGNLRQEKKGRRGQGNGRKSYVHSCLSRLLEMRVAKFDVFGSVRLAQGRFHPKGLNICQLHLQWPILTRPIDRRGVNPSAG